MSSIVRGLDVSHYQPSTFDWAAARDRHGCQFVYVRATYGIRQDELALEHTRHARDAGYTVGLYHFFRPDQSVVEQGNAFREVAEQCHLGVGDMLPAVDTEAYPWQGAWVHPQPEWCPALQELFGGLSAEYGSAVSYGTASDWARLGRPQWLLRYPQWVAHWPPTGAEFPLDAPTTPGNAPWSIWQQMVGVLGSGRQAPLARGAVDQDVARLPLPLIGDLP